MIKVSCNTNYILYVDIFNLILKSVKDAKIFLTFTSPNMVLL